MWLLWMTAQAATLGQTYPPPPGFERVEADAFGQYVQALALRDADEPVRNYDGRQVYGHRAHVLDIPLVSGDLQQCADAILRIRGEFLRAAGATVMFHSTSGEPMPWSRYQRGERARGVGDHLELSPEQGWWDWGNGVALPHWPLRRDQLRRWR